MSVSNASRGFGIVEALVAATIVLAACLGLAGAVVVSRHAEGIAADRATLDQALRDERARLVALPFCTPILASSSASPWRPVPPSLLAEVFPWASMELDTTAGTFSTSEGVGVFASERRVGALTVRREARFVRHSSDGDWVDVPVDALEQWTIERADTLPASAIRVVLSAGDGRRTSTLVAHFIGLPPTFDSPSQ